MIEIGIPTLKEIDSEKKIVREKVANALASTFKKSEKDTRLKHIYLTEKGQKLFEEIFSIQKKRIYKALINSNSKEVLHFNNVIKRIIDEKI